MGTRRASDGRAEKKRFVTGRQRVWLLTLGLFALAAALYVFVDRHLDRPSTDTSALPLLALIALFAVSEVFVVHLRFRHDAHTFSLSEIPLMLGLFYASPEALVCAQLIGGGLILALHRRQPAIKLVFNLAIYTLSVMSSVTVFHAAMGSDDPFGPGGWAAGFASAMTVSVISVPAIYLAVTLSDGRPGTKEFLRPVVYAVFASCVAASIGLLAVEVTAAHPFAELLLIVPALGLHVAYRAYVQEREKHQALQFLYDSTRVFHQSPELEQAVNEMLAQARNALGAEIAAVAYASMDGGVVVNRVGPEDSYVRVVYVKEGALAELRTLFDGDARSFRFNDTPDHPLLAKVGGPVRLRDGIVVALTGASGMVGALVVANSVSEVTAFQREDVRLLETLGSHMSMALQNGRLEQSVAQLLALEQHLTHQANHDPLTGLANRTLFERRVTEALAQPSRRVAVLFVDIDDFKTVNDSLGHSAGDTLLISVAERITTCIRDADAAARLGGDEFGLVLDDVADLRTAVIVADRLLEVIGAPVSVAGQRVAIDASIGIAFTDQCEETAVDAAVLMRNADTAMYAAKARGKGRWVVFSPEMHEAARYRQSLTRDFADALTNGEFVAHFQPIVDLATQHVVAAEALLRWVHPTIGVLDPLDFIPIAEETGHINQITEAMLLQVCEEAARWTGGPDGTPAPAVSVNLSARDFEGLDLAALIPSILVVTGLDPHRLIIEITESLMLTDAARNNTTLCELAACGVRLAIDDFGTGYSSLSYLSRLPLHLIKIAKPFVDDLGKDAAQDALAHGIVKLSHALHVGVVAEGIERESQVAALRLFGCDLGQGYLYSRPIAPHLFPAWLARAQGRPQLSVASSA
jgi:diguanylate cyclase (GGDEF)-like protein